MLVETLVLDRGDGLVDEGVLNLAVREVDPVDILTSCELGEDIALTVVYE